MKNTPYVKQFDENGKVTNPIKGSYLHEFENREERRAKLQKDRFHGESKNHHLTVAKSSKYKRVRQVINCEDKHGVTTGERRVIEHYV